MSAVNSQQPPGRRKGLSTKQQLIREHYWPKQLVKAGLQAAVDPERRRVILDLLRHSNVSRLRPDDRLVYVLGVILADSEGHVDHNALTAAAANADACAVARALIREAIS